MDKGSLPRFTVLALCVLAFAVRVYRLDAQAFWFDEGLTFDLVRAPPAYVIATLNRPPLYYLLMHVWVSLSGLGPLVLRFFSVGWSVLAVALSARLAHDLQAEAGVTRLVAVCATLAPFAVYYAQEARPYSLTLALALLSTGALVRWLKHGAPRMLALHMLASVACFYTHYTALFLPLGQVALVLAYPRPRGLRVWLGAQVGALVLFAPWPIHAAYALPEIVAPPLPTPALTTSGPLGVLWLTLREFSAGRTLPELFALPMTGLFLFLLILGVSAPEWPRATRLGLLGMLVVPVMALALLPRSVQFFSPKYLIVAFPAFLVLSALGLHSLRRAARALYALSFSLVVLACLLALWEWFAYSHVKGA